MIPKIYLACESPELAEAEKTGFHPAQMIYRAGANGRLYRQKDAPPLRVGLPVIDCRGAMRLAPLADEIADECRDFGFDGAVIEGCPELAERLDDCGLTVFTDESTPVGIRLIGTAVSGGSLEERLREEQRKGPIAAEIEVTRMDFTIPEKRGVGRELTRAELTELLRETGSTPFFSREMRCFYFNYREDGKRHFVLYDNAESILSKIKLLSSLGVEYAFLCYAQVKDLGVLEKIK